MVASDLMSVKSVARRRTSDTISNVIPDPLAALGGRRIGVHLALGRGMMKAAERARAIGATTVQIFTDNPTAWRRRGGPPGKLADFRARLASHDIRPTVTHAAYLINLAGSEEAFWRRSVDLLAAELRMAALYHAAFVNMHVGSHRGTDVETGRRRLADGIARAFVAERDAAAGDAETSGSTPILVLENSAGGGDGMGTTVAGLADILETLEAAGVPMARIGVCLDTAHLWGAGHEISRPEVLDAVLADFELRIGLQRLLMIHLNDSRAALGSRLDRHEHLGAGRIGEDGLRHLVKHPRLAGLPMVLETPGMDEGYDLVNMDRVRALVAGEPLALLPPEAFTLRGSRAAAGPLDA
jgi:deoxyribonuclease IV